MPDISLPTIAELVSRQIDIQGQIESGALDPSIGAGYIANLHRIVQTSEIAEQAAQASKEEMGEDSVSAFNSSVTSEEEVKAAMIALYQDLESGRVSGLVATQRIKVLESIAKTYKNSALVEIKVDSPGEHVTNPELLLALSSLEERIRSQGEIIKFACKEIGRLTKSEERDVMEALIKRKSLRLPPSS